MSLLLCAATEFEIASTIRFLREQQLATKVGVLITGVGLPSSMYRLTKQIMLHTPSIVIQAGVAGSFSTNLPLGEVLTVERDSFGDLGVHENGIFKTLFDMHLAPSNEKPWSERWLINPHTSLMESAGLVTAYACSVNEVTTDPNRILHYTQSGAQLESMEGAGLHYIALMEDIPFLQIRSVSNHAGERDKSKWAMELALTRLNTELQRIVIKYLDL